MSPQTRLPSKQQLQLTVWQLKGDIQQLKRDKKQLVGIIVRLNHELVDSLIFVEKLRRGHSEGYEALKRRASMP